MKSSFYIIIWLFSSQISQAFLPTTYSFHYRPLPLEPQTVSRSQHLSLQHDIEPCEIYDCNCGTPVKMFTGIVTVFLFTYFMQAPASWAADLESATPTFNTHATIITSSLTQGDIFASALNKAIGGGKAGALAAVVQVFSLMWLRTAMNYQYRFGGTLPATLKTLWNQGGISRFYQGLPFALIQGPLTRFGDTFSNVGSLALLQQVVLLLGSDPNVANQYTSPWGNSLILANFLSSLPVKTAIGSITAALFRVLLMPIDTCKTVMQVDGGEGLKRLYDKIKETKSIHLLYQGSLASAAATAVGHFPWFLTYNYLNEILPSDQRIVDSMLTWITPIIHTSAVVDEIQLLSLVSLIRSALIGFSASCVSDTSSNSLRVIKTTKQTAAMDSENGQGITGGREISYQETIKMIVQKDGLQGLFGRGLQTRLLTNAIQGAAFSVLWRYFQQH